MIARLLLVIVLLAAALPLMRGSPRAFACSPDPDWNPVAESNLIVAGRVTGWGVASDLIDQPSNAQEHVAIYLTMDVETSLNGNLGTEIPIIDRKSANADGSWHSLPSCGSAGLGGDPTDKLAIFGLNHTADGYERGNIFYLDEDVDAEGLERTIKNIVAYQLEHRSTDPADYVAAAGVSLLTFGILGQWRSPVPRRSLDASGMQT